MAMGKKWIEKRAEMVRSTKWRLVTALSVRRISLFLLIASLMLGLIGCGTKSGEETTETWKKTSSTQVASQTYRDAAGHEIVYYCCRTIYYDEKGQAMPLESETGEESAVSPEPSVSEDEQATSLKSPASEGELQLDRQALSAVIDLDQAETQQMCTVGDWPALLCQQDGHTYLCWTISLEYSCIIQYDATAVTEEDIFRMAESVTLQE